MIWMIVANIVKLENGGQRTVQLPTFHLDGNNLGIINKEQARKIALDIINPTKDESITADIMVVGP